MATTQQELPKRSRIWRIRSFPREQLSPDNFELAEQDIAELKDNELLIRADYFSVDPYMRTVLTESSCAGPNPKLGDVMRGGLVGLVLASKSSKVKTGEQVGFVGPWAEYSVRNADHVRPLPEGVDEEGALSAVGMTALTAFFGLRDVANLKRGERILVTSAGGAVGYVVCKIAQLNGAEPIALCGTPEKAKFLRELGVKHIISYKANDAVEQIKRIAPEGVDVLWDNIGGKSVAPFRKCLGRFGRLVQCGAVSTYNVKDAMEPAWEKDITFNSWTVKGFVVQDFHSHFDEALGKLAQWYREGKIPSRVSVREGFENLPVALSGLFKGENIGKQIVKVSSARGSAIPSAAKGAAVSP